MGKKSSSSAPAVDPAVGEAMQKQAAIAQQQQNWYENELYPWMREQTNKQNQWSEEDRLLAQQNTQFWQDYATTQTDRLNKMSDEYYNRWKEQYVPIENALLADAKNYNTSAEAERQAQAAIGDMRMAQHSQRQQTAQQMAQYGINPTSGAYQGQMRALDLNQAALSAAAANQARTAAQQLGWQKQMQVAALGQQYIGNSLNAAQGATSTAGTTGGLAQNSLNQQSSFGQLGLSNINTLANVGLNSYQSLSNAWGQYGQLGMDKSNYNMSAWQAQQQANAQQSAGMMGAIGTIGGAAIAAF
ncbi:hypothetical protein [uncultured Sutterella sp.]|uniref:hypothetical protein n=1 Tax=uncultured Sutterella sp. TaxID=286133 RepID=UPI00266F457A|nr:hypothetical protein [uncultured Sutterella sp.]